MHLGVKSILMSGSGPAVFGIVSSRKEAVSLAKVLKKSNRLWRVFVTQTCFSRQ
jgi:4-diphosphocytidyl-2C-methyl-D-erythritol kinase